MSDTAGRTTAATAEPSGLERYFELSRNGTELRTEIVAGITTFLTMASIVFVNPQILGTTGWTRAQCSSRPASPPRRAAW
jgi:xanthine/uracil/vitamin C permease (AzgA family)